MEVGSGAYYYYLNDRLGTPVLMVDATNTAVWEANVSPFGKAVVNPNSAKENNFRFAGQYYDNETGLHYNWHRYYNPRTGRYLTPDPIGLATGINHYAYVDNDPIIDIDPEGLAPFFAFGKRSVEEACDEDPCLSSSEECRTLRKSRLLKHQFMMDAATFVAPILLGLPPIPQIVPKNGGRATTDFLSDVTVKSRGNIVGRGAVDLRGTIGEINSGQLEPRDVFQNREGLLPQKPPGYYKEFVHPTPGVKGEGSQRIIQGQGRELFYTPDHYNSFIPLN